MCNSKKPAKRKYCSQKCAQLNSRKVDWDSVDLFVNDIKVEEKRDEKI